MNKYCPNCKMNFSESFEECPCCEGILVEQDLSLSEYFENVSHREPDILDLSDEELLNKYQDYLQSIRRQGCQMTDKEFVEGLREGRKDKLRRVDPVVTEEQWHPTITCPYCKSTDCKKISGLSKAGSVALWGIFALGKTTKQFHCNSCKADF